MDWYRRVGTSATWLVCLCVMLGTVDLSAQTATKAAPNATSKIKLESTALSLIPSDAAFFSSTLNLRQSLLNEVQSGWISELRQVPYVHQLEEYLQTQWDNPQPQAQQVKNFLTSPIVQDILLLLSDMSAQECFMFGDKTWCTFLEGFSTFQYEFAGLNSNDPDAMREYFLGLEKADLDGLPIPTTIIGFQLSEDGNARTQLDALEGVLQLALSSVEPLRPIAKGLKRKDLANGQVLSMTFMADDIPWESFPVNSQEINEVIEHMADLLQGRRVVFSMGVISNRFMLCFSESSDTLIQLGKGANWLTTSTAKHLAKNQPNNLCAIQFTSGDFRSATWESQFGNYFERVALQMLTALNADEEKAEKLADWQEKLLDDCEWLDEQVAELMPDYKDILAYSYESGEGLETFTYDWTPSWILDSSKPLTVIRHGGTSPLLLSASRQKWVEGAGEMMEAILDELPEHMKMVMESGVLEDGQREKFQIAMTKMLPLLEDAYAAVRDKIVAGMDGNEFLVAASAQATATSLNPDAPAPPAPLPLPEVGVVLKIKNKDAFLSGCDEVIRCFNSLMDIVREDGAPDAPHIPEPKSETMAGGAMRYSYPMGLPAPWDQFEIQMAIGNDVAVMGYSTRQVRDLYQDRPLVARPAWFTPTEPTAAVGFVDIAGIFKAIKPWIHYALSMNNESMETPLGPGQGDVPVPTGSDVLQIWDTFKKLGKSAGTTVVDKDGVTVSHWIWVRE